MRRGDIHTSKKSDPPAERALHECDSEDCIIKRALFRGVAAGRRNNQYGRIEEEKFHLTCLISKLIFVELFYCYANSKLLRIGNLRSSSFAC